MKKQVNQLRSGVVLSYINLLLGSLLPFFYTPLMLDMLGVAEHGLYSISSSVIGYLSLLSFGFGGTIVRYIAKYRANDDKEGVERITGFFLVLYCGIGILMMLCGWGLSQNVGSLFAQGLTTAELQKIRILVLIMTFNTALSFPLSAFTSVVLAYERYVFRRIIDIFTTIATPCLNLLVLYLGYASVGMAVSSVLMGVLTLPLNIIYCFRILHIKPKFGKVPAGLVREITVFSFFIFLGTLVDMLFWSTDKVILGMLVGTVSVSVYQIGSTFNQIVIQLSSSISTLLTPKVTGMIVKNASHQELTDLFIRIGRIQFLIIALVVTGFTAFGRSFILLWVGDTYLESYWIAILTLFPLAIPLIQNTGLSILVAQNKHRFRSIVYFIIAILNVVSTYLLVPYMGGIGAALCSCISYLLGQGLIMNIYYHRVIGLDIPLFWKNIIKMTIFPLCLMVATLSIQRFFQFSSWVLFFAGVVVYTVIYLGLMYCFSMNDYEKSIVRSFIKLHR